MVRVYTLYPVPLPRSPWLCAVNMASCGLPTLTPVLQTKGDTITGDIVLGKDERHWDNGGFIGGHLICKSFVRPHILLHGIARSGSLANGRKSCLIGPSMTWRPVPVPIPVLVISSHEKRVWCRGRCLRTPGRRIPFPQLGCASRTLEARDAHRPFASFDGMNGLCRERKTHSLVSPTLEARLQVRLRYLPTVLSGSKDIRVVVFSIVRCR